MADNRRITRIARDMMKSWPADITEEESLRATVLILQSAVPAASRAGNAALARYLANSGRETGDIHRII